jgi:hypothetical protein
VTIVAAHLLLYTPEAEALRAVLRDVLHWDFVEDSPGWLIFRLPAAEIGVHPSEGSTEHQICLMCDDLEATMTELGAKGIEFRGGQKEESFGITTTMLLPGGVELLLYQPKHASPLDL